MNNTMLYMPRTWARHALLQQPFRLFFLGASLFASLGMLLWATFLHLGLLPASSLSPLYWHGHEMLFGFAGALIAGFLLTAVANWTGQPTSSPGSLTLLVTLWLAARLGFLLPTQIPFYVAAALDCAFYPLLAVIIARPILRSRNYRNLFVVPLLGAFALADILFCLSAGTLIQVPASRILLWTIDLITVLMLVVGGRIIPFFTSRRLPTARIYRNKWLEWCVNGGAALIVLLDIALPGGKILGVVSLTVGILAFARLSGWQSWRTWPEPMLWVLHAGYLWLIAGLILRGIALLGGSLLEITAMHAVTVGALGSLAIGMMLRVSQGHTGRPLKAGYGAAVAFALVSIAAVLRLTDRPGMLSTAGVLWAMAFGYLFVRLLPIHFGPKRI